MPISGPDDDQARRGGAVRTQRVTKSVNRAPGTRNAETRLTCFRRSGGVRRLPRLDSNQQPSGASR
jgi:hypothetical protein